MVRLCPEGWMFADYVAHCERANWHAREREEAMKVVDERIIESTVQHGLFATDEDTLVMEIFV